MSSDLVQYEQRGAIGILTMNRPERLNAINNEMLRAMRAFFDERHRDFGCRVIVVTGAGRGFCAGLDLKAEGEQDPWAPGVGPVMNSYAFQEDIADLVVKMRRCPQPIIAAVNGPATGGGLSIALASDVRMALPTAVFACSFLNLGLSGCDVGSSYHLPKVIGASNAADMIYSGRLVPADEALAMGLVSAVVDDRETLMERCMAMADSWIAKSSPMGLRLSKEVLNETVTGVSLETALKLENRNQILAGQTADSAESRQAFMEKRQPLWRDE